MKVSWTTCGFFHVGVQRDILSKQWSSGGAHKLVQVNVIKNALSDLQVASNLDMEGTLISQC